jgi:hypothetical protein
MRDALHAMRDALHAMRDALHAMRDALHAMRDALHAITAGLFTWAVVCWCCGDSGGITVVITAKLSQDPAPDEFTK